MKSTFLLPVLLLPFFAVHAEEDESRPVSMKKALEAGPEKLCDMLGDQSEAGMDRAAALYATARRLDTESKLAARDVSQVLALDDLRKALSKWNQECSAAGYMVTGGGTMWSHGSVRAMARIEDMLAVTAASMPLKTLDPKEGKTWKALGHSLDGLKLPKDAAEADPEAPKQWTHQKEVLRAAYEELGWSLNALEPEVAAPLLEFARDCLEEVATSAKELQ